MAENYIDISYTTSNAGNDETVISIPGNKIGHLRQINIYNGAASDAVVILKDVYTDSDGTSHTDTKLEVKVSTGADKQIQEDFKLKILGTLKINSTQDGVVLTARLDLE